jgi:type I restriction enzyme S subunit
MNSDALWDYANSNAAGTMSKRVKWRDLAEYEFLLPPKEEQAKIAELLWAMDEVIEWEKEVLESLEINFISNRKCLIERGAKQMSESKEIPFGKICDSWKTEKLKNISSLIGGNAFRSHLFQSKGEYQVLRIGNITENGFDFTKSPVFVNELERKELKYLIPSRAIILSLTGTNGRRDYGFPSLMVDNNKYLLNQRLVMLIPDTKQMLAEFLFLISKMELFQGKFFLNATGSANQANVSISDLGEIEVPVPNIEEQRIIINKMDKISTALSNSKATINKSQSLQKSLINQVF